MLKKMIKNINLLIMLSTTFYYFRNA